MTTIPASDRDVFPEDETSTVSSEIGPWAMVPAWVLEFDLSGADLKTYVALRSFADRQGAAHPSVPKIAARAGLNPKTAEKCITRLRALGLVATKRKYRADGSIAGCDYRLRDTRPAAGGTRHMAGVSPSDGGGTPANWREQEHTNEHTKEHTKSASAPADAPRRRPTSSQRPDWRQEDRDLFRSLVGSDTIVVDADVRWSSPAGKGKAWSRPGVYSLDKVYDALVNEGIDWPGRYGQGADGLSAVDGGIIGWLDRIGLYSQERAA